MTAATTTGKENFEDLNPKFSSAPLPGHALLCQGAAFMAVGTAALRAYPGTAGRGFARCECDARSAVLDSGAARRAWHRAHKDGKR